MNKTSISVCINTCYLLEVQVEVGSSEGGVGEGGGDLAGSHQVACVGTGDTS